MICHITDKFASETVSFVRDYIKANPDLERNTTSVIEGWGWDHASWDVAKMPSSVSLVHS